MGEVLLGRKIGKKAMLLGAVAQSIPDIDVIAAGFTTDAATYLVIHRGFTHSILFDVFASLIIAVIFTLFSQKSQVRFRGWFVFFLVEMSAHIFLDLFNTYGTGLLEPFSSARFSFNAIYVVDPFLTIIPSLLVIFLAFDKRKKWKYLLSRLAVGWVGIYLFYCLSNKLIIREDTEKLLQAYATNGRVFTTPTQLNNWLWFVVADADSGYYTGYRSVFDNTEKFDLKFYPKNEFLLQEYPNKIEIEKLKKFSEGYYVVQKWQDTLVFNDLRFGQIIGWHEPNQKFVFHYFLKPSSASNKLVMQRGRFAKWTTASNNSLARRIAGN